MCCCCWPFADAWLEDPDEEADRQEANSSRDVMWTYVPTPKEKSVQKASSRRETSSKEAMWTYEPPPKDGKEKKVMKYIPASIMAGDEDYEHWSADDETVSVASTGYDSNNGLHSHIYRPANQENKKKEAPAPAVPEPAQQAPFTCIPVAPQQQMQYMMPYPQMQQQQYPSYMPQMAYPAPAYYGYPSQMQAPPPPYGAGGYAQLYQPPAPAPEEKKKKPKNTQHKWQGRTKAEVEEDNMKIAMREGVYDERKVEPVGLKEDQVMWCVEGDGRPQLRTYATIKELKGEWKSDPRFVNSWYFVCEVEEGEGKK